MTKYLLNQRIRLISEYNTTGKIGKVGYIDRVDPADCMGLVYRLRLDGAHPSEWEWVREQDIEPEAGLLVVCKTLDQVKAEVAALDAQEAAANTTLASIAEHREKLTTELAAFGLSLIAIKPTVAPATMGELYSRDAITKGDVFTFIGPTASGRDWVIGQQYKVNRVDSDESVLTEDVLDEDAYEWAWKNEGAFEKFVKAA